ncbi:Lipoxygenase [Trema orientale]|uniref:Lipoxygenase n=1 Tax=Trema orientale TaxID=63057 RepID=A0A2P5CFQ0_TREOI|nr:Lipoxygenase [Trema orientale]
MLGGLAGKVVDTITGNNGKKIKGSVVLIKKNVLDFNAIGSSVIDRVGDFLGNGVSLQLVSSDHGDAVQGSKGKVGKVAHLENWLTALPQLTPGESVYGVTFDWDESIGVPGALIIKNNHVAEFFLKTITLEDVPGEGLIRFVCNSWVYPASKYKYDRVFFRNKSYLPSETPAPLRKYREEELGNLRGNGKGERQEWDRVYDYDVYNDLGEPDKGSDKVRQILGGSSEFPYPRRGRTGRPPTKTDPNVESRLKLVNIWKPLDPIEALDIYVPRDERFGHLKMSDFLAYGLKSLSQSIKPALEHYFDQTPNEFDNFKEVDDLYEGGFTLPTAVLDTIRKTVPFEMLKEVFRTDGEQFLKFPKPHVVKEDKSAWRTDAEFGRETIAGVNPVVIRRLEEFPPASKLDPRVYGDQTSKITEDHIQNNLDGLGVYEALYNNKLFILDHHDSFIPYLRKINTTSTKTYASRTLLFLKNDGTLKPVAIELSLPHPDGDQHGAVSKVYTPAEEGVEGTIWQLAKAYAAVNDSGYHQLISHWLNTHAVIEPFVIATNRQLSALHPIHKLLQPHYRDTMNINALARQTLINAGGILESTVFPGKYALELSAVVYKNWVFSEQALPADLLKRGLAVKDPSAPHGLRLLIEDYPYAVDGLEIWSAIRSWVEEYCSYYYKTDDIVQKDTELQAWWKELREVGHGDKKDEPWWPKLQTREELVESCAIIIWISSALHAAVNFGQYPYAGYLPNRPTVSRRFMPENGTPEYEQLKSDPEKGFLLTITSEFQTLIGVSLIEILSRHASDEVYLGQRDTPDWTAESDPLQAFERFGRKLSQIEDKIVSRNKDTSLKNRAGPVNFPYTLLHPTSEEGLTAKGIPNSISI